MQNGLVKRMRHATNYQLVFLAKRLDPVIVVCSHHLKSALIHKGIQSVKGKVVLNKKRNKL